MDLESEPRAGSAPPDEDLSRLPAALFTLRMKGTDSSVHDGQPVALLVLC